MLWKFENVGMNILILADRSDPHAVHLQQVIAQIGVPVYTWNTQEFPTQIQLSWQPATDRGRLILPEGKGLDFDQIHSVFWRSFTGVQVPQMNEPHQSQIAFNDSISLLRSVLQACPARWINSWQAYQFHKEKPLQLRSVQQLGIPIPATLISNDPAEILQFCANKRTIFKPVYGGALTQPVTAEHLEQQRLRLALKTAPVTIQEYIPGTNIRSYVLGEKVYSAEIQSSSVDFRADATAELIPLTLPQPIEQGCLQIARRLRLVWTAIDWRRTPQDEYIFLEANPSPMFLYFEQQTGFPITQELVRLLVSQ